MQLLKSVFLIVIFASLGGCGAPTKIFTDQQETELESRLAKEGIKAEYDSPLTFTTGEQGIAIVVEGPLPGHAPGIITSVITEFLKEQGLQQYSFVGVFIRGSGGPINVIDLDPVRARTKPVWKGPGTILAPVVHKAQH